MMKVYTPKEWLSFFGGSPSLIIDDKGYIYSADGYYKLISDSPIGKIDYEKGHIYDKHYADLFPTPIAYMVNSDGVTKVMEYGKSHFSAPILYIQNDKIYTPDEYHRIFSGSASGYIKRDTPSGSSASSSRDSFPKDSASTRRVSSSFWDSKLGGAIIFIGVICIFLLWQSVDTIVQKGPAFWIPLVLFVAFMLVGSYLKKQGKLGKSAANKRSVPKSTPAFKSAPKTTPVKKATRTAKPQQTRTISCPHCGTKCRIPANIGKIRVNCPNSACGRQYEVNT